MFPSETFELIKRILTLNVAMPRQNVETILNSYELFIYGYIGYSTNSFCKNVLNNDTQAWLGNCIFIHFCSIIHIFLLHTMYRKIQKQSYAYIIIFQLSTAAFKAYSAIWVRRSNFRHQASPRVSPRESTQQWKVELWARNVW
jgi:hypothetical protein